MSNGSHFRRVPTVAEPFDADYYEDGLGPPYRWDNPEWPRIFGKVADFVVDTFAPRTVLDAGCGVGFLVDALRARGVDAWGIDVSTYAISQVPEPLRPYCAVGSITDEIEGRYDLITCIEVLEHVPPELADLALDNFAAHTDRLLFSSSPDDLDEPTHVNVRPVAEWVLALADRGLLARPVRGTSTIAPQTMVFERRDVSRAELAAGYETMRWELVRELEEAQWARWFSLRHGRLLLRRTREVYVTEGSLEVARRGIRVVKATTARVVGRRRELRTARRRRSER